MTFRNAVLFRNNTSCHESCPVCGIDHKPPVGLVVALQPDPAGAIVCEDCADGIDRAALTPADENTINYLQAHEDAKAVLRAARNLFGNINELRDVWREIDAMKSA